MSLDALHRFLQRERVVRHAADGHVRALAARAASQAAAKGMFRARCVFVHTYTHIRFFVLLTIAAAENKAPPPVPQPTASEQAAAKHSALILAHRSIPGVALTTRERLSLVSSV